MVNIVGDHATYHRPFDAPLTADTEGLARAVSHWVRTSSSAARVGADGAAAVQAAMTPPGQIATLILPADTAWNEGGEVGAPLPVPARPTVAPDTLRAIAQALRSREPAMLILSGQALSEAGLVAAHRVAHASGAKLRTPTQVATHGARPRARAGRSHSLRGRQRAQGARRHAARDTRRRETADRVLRLSRQAEPDLAARRRHARARAAGAGRGRRARMAGRRAGRTEERRRSRTAAERRSSSAESSSRKPSPARWPRCCPRTASSPRTR